jgi:hypothetical protein
MIVFAAIVIFVIIAIACAGLVFAQFDSDDLRNMGIRL